MGNNFKDKVERAYFDGAGVEADALNFMLVKAAEQKAELAKSTEPKITVEEIVVADGLEQVTDTKNIDNKSKEEDFVM